MAHRGEVRAALRRFTAVGVLAVLVIGLVTAAVTWRLAGRQALLESEIATQQLAELTLGPLLDEGLVAGEPDALAALDGVVRARISDGSVLGLTVWDADWTVLYSDDPRLIGRSFPRPEWAPALLASGSARAELIDGSQAESPFDDGRGLVEVYAATTAGPGPLVVEAYWPDKFLRRHQRSLLVLLLPAGVIGLVLLQVAQLPLALRLAHRLEASSDSRRRLLAQAVAAADLERRRLARDLHDEVIQDLAGASYAMEALETQAGEAAKPLLARTRGVVRHAVATLRGVLTDLYSIDVDDVGLREALERLAAPLEAEGTRVDLDLPERADLDRTTATLVYRVAREALRNTGKHAEAARVTVTLRVDRGVVLRIVDDGRGFHPDAIGPEGHLGLRLVRDTVAEAGGTVTLRSAVGNGTDLEMVLPG